MALTRVFINSKLGKLEILFRQLGEPMPARWKAGLHWQVEAYEDGMEQPPVGFCWVCDTTPMCPPGKRPLPSIVEHVSVFPPYLRCGVATALLDAVRRRWPNVELTAATSPEGEALHASRATGQERRGVLQAKQTPLDQVVIGLTPVCSSGD